MRKKEARILIVDDDEDILFSARVWLKNSSQKLLPLILPIKYYGLQNHQIDVILLDMNFRRGFEDGKEGLYWLSEIKEIDKDVPVILMTAYGEVELAVEALKMAQPILF
jgi:DNA-binding NtrC family response regulator